MPMCPSKKEQGKSIEREKAGGLNVMQQCRFVKLETPESLRCYWTRTAIHRGVSGGGTRANPSAVFFHVSELITYMTSMSISRRCRNGSGRTLVTPR